MNYAVSESDPISGKAHRPPTRRMIISNQIIPHDSKNQKELVDETHRMRPS
jgi:hypothetical protein